MCFEGCEGNGSIGGGESVGDITAEEARSQIGALRDEELLIMQDFNAEYIATVAKPKRP